MMNHPPSDSEAAARAPGERWLRRDLLGVFVGAALFFLALLSREYIGDGYRWLPYLTGRDVPGPGGNNHFLTPYLGWGAWRLVQGTGFSSLLASVTERPVALAFFQGLNALLGAAGLVALFLLLHRCGVSRRGAWLGVALTGLSHAYLLHATDMTEPMASVPWMLLAAAVVRRAPESRGSRWLGGALAGLSGAFYLTSIGVCVLLGSMVGLRYLRHRQLGRGVVAVLEVGLVAVGTLLGILLVGRWLSAAPVAVGGHAQSFFELPTGGGLFGHFDPRHLMGAVFGFANAFAPLWDWLGAARLLEAPRAVLAYNLTILALLLAFVVAVGLRLRRAAPMLLRSDRAADLAGALLWTVCTYLVASYWSATYEKLWMGGVVGSTLVLCLLFEGGEPEARESESPVRHWFPLAPVVLLVLISLVAGGVRRRVMPNEDLHVATELSKRLRPSDVAICAGWDEPSSLLTHVVTPSFECWSIVNEMIATRLRPEVFTARLRALVDQARAEHRRVYFFGLLDQSEEEWRRFNGERLKLPYSVLEPYRGQAVVVERLRGKGGAEFTLYQLCDASTPGCPPTASQTSVP
ncbi:hypothetical protein [Vitiosangium sp. GDMCC 1.1324]|uniref:hypothetical protein n=1 Tax=Vitiosangium sp. (strain GDMCC 1.1324) TaxID=2138576 RepID=UPI000D437553|nr:hypothetical protein [Vitiosangium sp. GDMCC 1.1324]PTL81828.1 hypothetical protein DAT35_23125 [Vitiosangium sp. GDMCC 1.1324]